MVPARGSFSSLHLLKPLLHRVPHRAFRLLCVLHLRRKLLVQKVENFYQKRGHSCRAFPGRAGRRSGPRGSSAPSAAQPDAPAVTQSARRPTGAVSVESGVLGEFSHLLVQVVWGPSLWGDVPKHLLRTSSSLHLAQSISPGAPQRCCGEGQDESPAPRSER